jgi:sugar phosphate isomerase/epimerase
MESLKIGIDNYGLLPLKLTPLQTLEWARAHGAEGVQFSGLLPEQKEGMERSDLDDLHRYAESEEMYIEWGGAQHIPFDTQTWKPVDVVSISRQAAEEANRVGARIIRSCSGGLMRWNPKNPSTEQLMDATVESLSRMLPMLKDLGITLAIELHFEFTTMELIRMFERCDADPEGPIGVCLDTMNLLVMLEDPVSATDRILPWIVSTHIKDGALRFQSEGLTAFPTGIGSGCVDLEAIIRRLSGLTRTVHLSIEDHGGSFNLPVFDPAFLERFPDLTLAEMMRLMAMAQRYSTGPEALTDPVTPREKWPQLCESRMAKNIKVLKKLTAAI